MYLFSRRRHVKGVIHKVRLGPFNSYVMLARVGGVHHFVTSIAKSIVMNNRSVLQKGGWGNKHSTFSVNRDYYMGDSEYDLYSRVKCSERVDI